MSNANIDVNEITSAVSQVVTEKSEALESQIKSLQEELKNAQSSAEEAKQLAADLEAKQEKTLMQHTAQALGKDDFCSEKASDAIRARMKTKEQFDLKEIDTKTLSISGAGDAQLAIDNVLGRTIIERAREEVVILGLIANKNVSSTDYREMVLRARPAVSAGTEQDGTTAPGDIWALTATTTYTEVAMNVGKQYAKPLLSDEVINDPVINLMAHLESLLVEELARYWALEVLYGNGQANNIDGILSTFLPTQDSENDADAGARAKDKYRVVMSSVEDGLGNASPTHASSAINVAIDLTVELPSRYHKNSKFVMNRRTLGLYRKLKDTQGRPLIQYESTGFVLVGYPVAIEDYCPDVNGTNPAGISAENARYPVIFGDLSQAYALCSIDDKFLVDPFTADGGTVLKYTARKGSLMQKNDAIVVLRSDADWT